MENPIKFHINFYNSLLSTGKFIKVHDLIDSYSKMSPSLHRRLSEPWLDISTLKYALTRIPLELAQTNQVILSKDQQQLNALTAQPKVWKKVISPNRRRLTYYNWLDKKMIFFITSDSDIDDILNALIAIIIEFKKIFEALKLQKKQFDESELINLFGISAPDFESLIDILGVDWKLILSTWGIRGDLELQYISSIGDFNWPFENWIKELKEHSLYLDLFDSPVYFVSSNTHSLTNLITGYVWSIDSKIFSYIEKNYPRLFQDWLKIKATGIASQVYDFVYYLSKIYFEQQLELASIRDQKENEQGIRRIVSQGAFDTVTQIIPLSSLPRFYYPDPQIKSIFTQTLTTSKAVIINIEYPLGQSAYYLFKTFLKHFKNIKGVYIIGKAAILNGNIGDIQIPNTVMEERNNAVINFNNIFNAQLVESSGVRTHGSQKAISLYGTYLENQLQMEKYQSDGYNVIEMESGSYLSAIYEHYNSNIFPYNGNFQLSSLPFELGIINYASDNPLVTTLGDTPLEIRGIEPTYAATSAVIRRIVELESNK